MKQSSVFPDQPFDAQKVRALQPSDTLVWIYFRLDNYRTKPLDQDGLNNIWSVFTTARSKGLKLVIRFAYNAGPGSTTDANLANPDAPIELVLQHIDQLKPILVENADVIAVMQAGFVGHWGEWHSSKYLHPLESRKAIMDALLSCFTKGPHASDPVSQIQANFYPGTPDSPGSLFRHATKAGSAITMTVSCETRTMQARTSRSRHKYRKSHQPTVMGKMPSPAGRTSLPQETQFTPMGGETCQYNPPRTRLSQYTSGAGDAALVVHQQWLPPGGAQRLDFGRLYGDHSPQSGISLGAEGSLASANDQAGWHVEPEHPPE